MISFDTETYLITRERPLPRLVCATISDDGVEAELLLRPDVEGIFDKLLKSDCHFVGCNIAFDFAVLAANFPKLISLIFDAYKSCRITDVAIRQQLFDIAYGLTFDDDVKTYSLEALVKLILEEQVEGKHGPDVWRLRYAELEGVPKNKWPASASEYAKNDAIYTWRVWNEQQAGKDLIVDDYEQSYSAFVLALMSARGMRTDPVAVAECRKLHSEKMEALRPELIDAGLIAIGGTKKEPKWVKRKAPAQRRIEAACTARGVVPLLTEKKQIAIDKAACVWCGDEVMLRRAQYGTAEKMISTYLPALEAGVHGPITSRFRMAATGRTTSSTPGAPQEGMNLQNAPRDGGVRECFVPRKGYLFLAADLSGAELHTLAQACKNEVGYSVLGETLKEGKDVHLWLAANLLGISYNDAMARYKAGDVDVVNARQDAKPANFGFPGVMSVNTFILTQLRQRQRVWKEDRVKALKAAWFRAFPEMEEYFAITNFQLGPEKSFSVKIYSSGRIRRVKTLPMACNTKFQSPAADGAKRALCEVSRRCYTEQSSALFGSRPCNFVHDEIMLEVRDLQDVYQPAAAEFTETMEYEFNTVVPDYPTTVEAVLMRRWSKGAKSFFDKKGGLSVWTPNTES